MSQILALQGTLMISRGLHDQICLGEGKSKLFLRSVWWEFFCLFVHFLTMVATLQVHIWRHDMETLSALLALLGESTGHRSISFTKYWSCEALMFPVVSFILFLTNTRVAGDLRRQDAHVTLL